MRTKIDILQGIIMALIVAGICMTPFEGCVPQASAATPAEKVRQWVVTARMADGREISWPFTPGHPRPDMSYLTGGRTSLAHYRCGRFGCGECHLVYIPAGKVDYITVQLRPVEPRPVEVEK